MSLDTICFTEALDMATVPCK